MQLLGKLLSDKWIGEWVHSNVNLYAWTGCKCLIFPNMIYGYMQMPDIEKIVVLCYISICVLFILTSHLAEQLEQLSCFISLSCSCHNRWGKYDLSFTLLSYWFVCQPVKTSHFTRCTSICIMSSLQSWHCCYINEDGGMVP